MKIGQRINILKKIAARLSEGNYPEGDLILRQFGLPWTNNWEGGEPYAYYLQMLEQGENNILLDLHEYLFPSELLPTTDNLLNSNNLWSNNTLRLFLSHSSTKKLIVSQIKQELKEYGVESFVAHEDIMPSKEWLREIQLALNTCHVMGALLCHKFRESEYCDQEVGFALQRNILVIPVRIEELNPHGLMAPLQAVTAYSKSPYTIAEEIYKIIANHPSTKSLAQIALNQALETLVDEFLTSSNYGSSTDLLRKLEIKPEIPSSLINKIADNWEKNDQISGCNGIPWRMQKFLKRYGIEITL